MRLTIDLDFLSPRVARLLPSFLRKRLIRRRFKKHRIKRFSKLCRIIKALKLLGIDPLPQKVVVRYSRKGAHVYVWLQGDIPLPEELTIRTILGDDPGRAARDFLRYARGLHIHSLMFSKKHGTRHEEPAPELTEFLRALWLRAYEEALGDQ